MTKIFDLKEYPITLFGKSNTGFYIPEINLVFDAKIEAPFDPEFILITHNHIDQCLLLPKRLSHPHPSIIAPKPTIQSLQSYVNETKYTYIGVSSGDIIQLNKKNMYVKIYDMNHTIPCVGYGLNCGHHVTKKEYLNIKKKTLISLRRTGVILTEIIHEPILIYLTDTTESIFDTYPEIFTYKYIIVECIYLPIIHDDIEEETCLAVDEKHLSWSVLYPIIVSHPTNIFILFHFSQKYMDTDIYKFICSINDKNIIFIK